MVASKKAVICPRCGKKGFWTQRWVRSSHYPRMGYYYYYVGHYSPEKYEKEMKDFRKGKRKSRPNGRIWHEVPVEVDFPMPHLRFPADYR